MIEILPNQYTAENRSTGVSSASWFCYDEGLKMRRNRRILLVFVFVWISIIVYLMYRDDASEVLLVSECQWMCVGWNAPITSRHFGPKTFRHGVWSKRRQTKTATGQNGDTKTATKLAWSKRRQVKTSTNQNGDRTKQRQVKTATGTLCG